MKQLGEAWFKGIVRNIRSNDGASVRVVVINQKHNKQIFNVEKHF